MWSVKNGRNRNNCHFIKQGANTLPVLFLKLNGFCKWNNMFKINGTVIRTLVWTQMHMQLTRYWMEHTSPTLTACSLCYVTCSDVRIFYSSLVVCTHKVQEVWDNGTSFSTLVTQVWCRHMCKGMYHLTLHIKARACCHWYKPFKCDWPPVFGKGGQTAQLSLPKKCLFRHLSPSNSIPPSPLKGDTLFYHAYLLYALVEPSPDQTCAIGTQPCVSPCQRGVSVCSRGSVNDMLCVGIADSVLNKEVDCIEGVSDRRFQL